MNVALLGGHDTLNIILVLNVMKFLFVASSLP